MHKNKYYHQTYFVNVLLTKTAVGKTLFKRCKGLQKIYFMLFIHRCGAVKRGRLLMAPIIIVLHTMASKSYDCTESFMATVNTLSNSQMKQNLKWLIYFNSFADTKAREMVKN